MIRFRRVAEENFAAVLDLTAGDERQFVPPNVEWLAQAWLYRDNNDVYCFGIYDDETLVGLMELDEDLEKRVMGLWRVMIDKQYQGKGLGTAAVSLVISLVRESGKYDKLELGCKGENAAGMHVYEKLGFRPTGEVEHGEVRMELTV